MDPDPENFGTLLENLNRIFYITTAEMLKQITEKKYPSLMPNGAIQFQDRYRYIFKLRYVYFKVLTFFV